MAVAAIFFLNGISVASWVVRIPDAQRALSLSAGTLGLALLGAAAAMAWGHSQGAGAPDWNKVLADAKKEGKVVFEFEPRPERKTTARGAARKTGAAKAAG